MKLSLAMIAKNEAAHLGHCLQSVQGLVDEIIVVDTGSEDATPEIARSFGAQVHTFPWQDDFAAARNASLGPCTGDWVLILDADEAIDRLDHGKLRQACEMGGAAAYQVLLRNYHTSASYSIRDILAKENTSAYSEGREHKYYVDTRGLRLCRRLPDLAFTGRVHELLSPCFERQGLPVRDLDVVIHHYGKLLEDREKEKAPRYLAWALADLEKNPTSLQCHFNVIQQAIAMEDWEHLVASAIHFAEHSRQVPSVVLFGWGLALESTGRFQEAVDVFDRLLRTHPSHAQALTHRGICLVPLGRAEEARKAFRKAIHAQPRFAQPYLNLTELAFKLGRLDEARATISQGLGACPTDPLIWNGLVLFDLWTKDVEAAMEHAAMALGRFPKGGGGLWHHLVALAHQKSGAMSEALDILDQGLALFPEDPDLLRMRGGILALGGR